MTAPVHCAPPDPFYDDGLASIFHADCLDVLPGLSGVDLIVTSPPYNLGTNPNGTFAHRKAGGNRGSNRKWQGVQDSGIEYDEYTDTLPAPRYQAWQQMVLAACWETLSDTGAIFYNHKPRVQRDGLWMPLTLIPGLRLLQLIIWERAGGINCNPTALMPTYEWILVLAKPDFRFRDRSASGVGDVWRIPQRPDPEHPAPFPIEIPKRAIETTSPDLVVDPFAGVGTTMCAAKLAGVRSIGIEISEKYCEIAAQRLSETEVGGPAPEGVLVSATYTQKNTTYELPQPKPWFKPGARVRKPRINRKDVEAARVAPPSPEPVYEQAALQFASNRDTEMEMEMEMEIVPAKTSTTNVNPPARLDESPSVNTPASQATPDGRPVLDPAALYGLAGRVVKTLAPETEADPAGMLMSILAASGVAIGPGPHAMVGATRHTARLFAVQVGDTSSGGKDTGWNEVKRVLAAADPGFVEECLPEGFASGEALVATAADAPDSRMLITETEFARHLNSARQVLSLSPVLRQAWDGPHLSTITKHRGRLVADSTHIGLVGHITPDELRARLTSTEMANGFGNRHLFGVVRRSQPLPTGGNLDPAEVERMGKELHEVFVAASGIGLMCRTPSATELWRHLYAVMYEDTPPGLIGALVARGRAQVLRLSLVYALLDASPVVDVPHVQAAWAVWQYCRASVVTIFGSVLGDVDAEKVFAALKRAAPKTLTTTQIHSVLSRNKSKKRMEEILHLVRQHEYIWSEKRQTGGRPVEVFRFVTPEQQAELTSAIKKAEEGERAREEEKRARENADYLSKYGPNWIPR